MKATREDIKKNLIKYDITEFQIEKIADEIIEYSHWNTSLDASVPDICPKCGIVHPPVIKGGKSNTGKQMYRCKACGKRFTATNGHLMEHSHLDKSKWKVVIMDTIKGNSLKATAKYISVNILTAFRMRHKLLRFLEDRLQNSVLAGYVEADETFVNMNGKGHIGDLELEVRNASGQAGIGKMACIACVVEPNGAAYCRSYNWGNIGCFDTEQILSHVEVGSTLITDGHVSYKTPSKKLELDRIIVNGKDSKLETNLNAINSFHNQIKELIRFYRGVSVKYINRYCALFSLRWTIKVKRTADVISYVKELIWNHRMHETLEQVLNENLWDPIASWS